MHTASATEEGQYIPPHQCVSPDFITHNTPGWVTYSSFTLNVSTSLNAMSIDAGSHDTRPMRALVFGLW